MMAQLASCAPTYSTLTPTLSVAKRSPSFEGEERTLSLVVVIYFVVAACALVVSKLLSELSAPSLVATVVVVAVFVLAALPPFRGAI